MSKEVVEKGVQLIQAAEEDTRVHSQAMRDFLAKQPKEVRLEIYGAAHKAGFLRKKEKE